MQAAFLLLLAGPLAAQQPTPPPAPAPAPRPPAQDTIRGRRGDTLPDLQNPRPDRPVTPPDTSRQDPDSLDADTLRPVLPPLGPPPGPLPLGHRYIFDGDALRWTGALTLGELLNLVPGVFVVRAGWYGQPETVSYAGQGSQSVELYWDGFALDPLGVDSAGFDTGRFDLGLFQRVEVEVLPTVLRVYLITDTQAARRARTEASFGTGDNSTNSYRIRYLNRWANGTGLSVSGSYFGTTGPSTSRGKVTSFQLVARGSWMPSDRVGVEFQVASIAYDREGLSSLGPTPDLRGVDARRGDLFVRAFTASRPDGMGLRLDAVLGSSTFSDTSGTLDESAGQAALNFGYRAARWSAEGWGRVRDTREPLDVGARLAWSPLRVLSLSGYGRRRSQLGGGGLTEMSAALELRPLSRISLHGDVRQRRLDDSTFVASDTAQRVTDFGGGLSLGGRVLSLDVGYSHRGAFSAPVFGLFADQLPLAVTAETNAFQASWRFQPWRWMGLSGWVRAPSSSRVPYDPPTHSVTRVTFRSAFLPHFRRNAFDVMAHFEMEAWGTGVAGADSTGALLALPGQLIFNVHIQFRLVGAMIFWTLRNTQITRYELLPGFEMPRSQQRFGIRWEFTN